MEKKNQNHKKDTLAEAKRIMERLVNTPPAPFTPKPKTRPASKGRVRKD